MEIGAAWWREKKDKDKQVVRDSSGAVVYQLSVQIQVPFLGKINFTLSPNDSKKAGGPEPDYRAFWWPPMDRASGDAGPRPRGPGAPGGVAPGGRSGGYDGGDDDPAW